MTAPVARTRPGVEREQGSASLFFVIALAGFLVLTGLVVDGGVKARALGRAGTLASEAARAAGQALDVPSVLAGARPVVDPARARAAALACLAASDATGTVTVGDGGRRITVQVTLTRSTVFLGLVGIRQVTAHGTATATLATGATP
jgi:hypothetical protein